MTWPWKRRRPAIRVLPPADEPLVETVLAIAEIDALHGEMKPHPWWPQRSQRTYERAYAAFERRAATATELLAFVREVAALQSAPAAHEACGFVLDARALVARVERGGVVAEPVTSLWQHLHTATTLPCPCAYCAALRQQTAHAERIAAMAPKLLAALKDEAEWLRLCSLDTRLVYGDETNKYERRRETIAPLVARAEGEE